MTGLDRVISDKVRWFSLQDQIKREGANKVELAKKSRKGGVKAGKSVVVQTSPVLHSQTLDCVKINDKADTENKRGTKKVSPRKSTKQNDLSIEKVGLVFYSVTTSVSTIVRFKIKMFSSNVV